MNKETEQALKRIEKEKVVEKEVEAIEEPLASGCKHCFQEPVFFFAAEDQSGVWKIVGVCKKFSEQSKARCNEDSQPECDFFEKEA